MGKDEGPSDEAGAKEKVEAKRQTPAKAVSTRSLKRCADMPAYVETIAARSRPNER